MKKINGIKTWTFSRLLETRCKNKVSNSARVLFFLTLTITKPWQHQNELPRGSKTETQSSRFLLHSILFRNLHQFFSLYQNSIRKSLWNGNLFLFNSRDSKEIFPPKKCDVNFSKEFPFGFIKNYYQDF